MGSGGFFPTNPDLANILGRPDLDFEIVFGFFGPHISGFPGPKILDFPTSPILDFPASKALHNVAQTPGHGGLRHSTARHFLTRNILGRHEMEHLEHDQ